MEKMDEMIQIYNRTDKSASMIEDISIAKEARRLITQKADITGGLFMPLQIVRNDITKMKVDAIVNAANSSLLGGGGVDGSHSSRRRPGTPGRMRKAQGCKTGSAKITKGYKLPCKYVIHAVGPRWYGGQYGGA